MINVVRHNPEYKFEDFTPYSEDYLDESGWWVKKEVHKIIMKWNIHPTPERNTKGKVEKQNQTPYWCAYRDVFQRNRFQPEQIAQLMYAIEEGLDKVISEKDAAILELRSMDADTEQANMLINFLGEVKQHVNQDKEFALDRLVSVYKQIR